MDYFHGDPSRGRPEVGCRYRTHTARYRRHHSCDPLVRCRHPASLGSYLYCRTSSLGAPRLFPFPARASRPLQRWSLLVAACLLPCTNRRRCLYIDRLHVIRASHPLTLRDSASVRLLDYYYYYFSGWIEGDYYRVLFLSRFLIRLDEPLFGFLFFHRRFSPPPLSLSLAR